MLLLQSKIPSSADSQHKFCHYFISTDREYSGCKNSSSPGFPLPWMQRLNLQQQPLHTLNNQSDIKLIDIAMFPLTLVQKQELNFHLIGSLREYFKQPPLEKKLQSSGTCDFVRFRGAANLIMCFKNCKRPLLAIFVMF